MRRILKMKTSKTLIGLSVAALLFGCSSEQADTVMPSSSEINLTETTTATEKVVQPVSNQPTAKPEKTAAIAWDSAHLAATIAAMPEGDIQRGELAHNQLMCIACHAVTGQPSSRNFVNLNAQPANYLKKMLIDYRDERRAESYGQSKIMTYISKELTDQDISDLAVFYEAQDLPKGKDAGFYADDHIVQLVRIGDMARGVISCAACHGSEGQGNGDLFPALAGQEADYAIRTLRAYRSGDRNNDVNGMMQNIAKNLTDEEIEGLAAYYENLNP
ncbi:c-type cytochrome [Thiomicrospira sp. R3]|uniref:c-type cytochrome n=1 Tax=Thiomicrospira sp. R3 TaxID=3035472 RepID=UPI00259B1D88|nr:c-type cytochrome [Thiomicrospira sp. R3]WFE68139.1 c-type cytochrome [Thiomicrospira sp. R3]